MKKILLLLLLLLFFVDVRAQSAGIKREIRLNVQCDYNSSVPDKTLYFDCGTGNIHYNCLYFGKASGATNGIDTQWGEYFLPPYAPLDLRFDPHDSIFTNGDGSYKDYRALQSSYARYLVHWQMIHYNNYELPEVMTFNIVNNSVFDSLRVRDMINGSIIDTVFTSAGESNFTLTDNLISLQNLWFDVYFKSSFGNKEEEYLIYQKKE